LTASDLLEKLKVKLGEEVLYSEQTLAKTKQDSGWTFAKYCQALRETSKAKQLEWYQQHILVGEAIDDGVFTD
jgi:hypothetical protein